MSEPDAYFDPASLALLASFESGHYWHLARREVILEALNEARVEGRFLDVGCGPGTTTTFLNRHGHHVDYADVHEEALTLARALAVDELGPEQTAERRFLQLDIAGQPLPAGYDGVLLLDVIEHLPDDVAALEHVASALPPGSRVLITVPAFPALWSRFDEINGHKRRYTRAMLRTTIEAAGLEIDHMTYFFAPLFVGAGAVKLARRGAREKLPRRWRAHDDGLEGLAETRTSPLLTRVVVRVLALERPIIRRGRLPMGTSLLAMARVPESAG